MLILISIDSHLIHPPYLIYPKSGNSLLNLYKSQQATYKNEINFNIYLPTHPRTHPWRSAGAQKGFRLFFLITGDTRLTNTQSYPAKVNEEYLVVSFLIVSVTSKHLVPLLTKTSSPPSLEVTLIILRKKHFGGILIC